ncbi:MAG: hypothetical protein M3R08_08340, partial [Bacteroidota bacterium]|nr:hypothetical protein [Bacteroidota bacterium]
SKDGSFDHVFGRTDEHIYMIMGQKKEMFVQKMDINNKKVYQKLLPMEIDKDDHTLERAEVFGDRILVFTTFYDKKERSNQLYLRVFDEVDMKPQGRLQRIATITGESKRDRGNFDLETSPDEKSILISQQLPSEKGSKEKFKLMVYDQAMTPSWEQEITLPYLDEEFMVKNMRIANDGSVIVMGIKYAEKKEARELRKDVKPSYEYHLLTYDSDGGTPEDHSLQVADKFLQDLTLNIGDEGDILAGGFYGLKGTSSIHGVYFMRLDRKTKAILHSNFKEFEKDFITAYMTEKEEKKATKKAEKKDEELEMVNYDLDDIIRRDDGGAVMVGEQYQFYVTTHTSTDSNGRTTTRTVYHYVYNDIIVVNIDPSGNIEWAAKVPKRQHTTNDGGYYSSYAMAVKDNMIYLVFNDNGKNLFIQPGQKIEEFRLTGKEALITLATIDGDGNVKREALLSPERRDAITRPKSCMQVSDDRMFIFAARKKDYRFGSMILQ